MKEGSECFDPDIAALQDGYKRCVGLNMLCLMS